MIAPEADVLAMLDSREWPGEWTTAEMTEALGLLVQHRTTVRNRLWALVLEGRASVSGTGRANAPYRFRVTVEGRRVAP